MQDTEYIRKRITELRLKKNISECGMSNEIGHNKNYIRDITSGKSLPRMTEFLYICEYLGVTPCEFFDERVENPPLVKELCEIAGAMSDEDLRTLIEVAKRMGVKK